MSGDELKDSDNNQVHLKKTLINLIDAGVTMLACDFHSVEKDMRFVEKPKAHWEYGIVINKGFNLNRQPQKTDITMWYCTENLRDAKYDRLLKLLAIEGVIIIEI